MYDIRDYLISQIKIIAEKNNFDITSRMPLEHCDVITLTCIFKDLVSREAVKDIEFYYDKELKISRGLETKFFPQRPAYEIMDMLTTAGFGKLETSPHGNTLLGMTKECLEAWEKLKQNNETIDNMILDRLPFYKFISNRIERISHIIGVAKNSIDQTEEIEQLKNQIKTIRKELTNEVLKEHDGCIIHEDEEYTKLELKYHILEKKCDIIETRIYEALKKINIMGSLIERKEIVAILKGHFDEKLQEDINKRVAHNCGASSPIGPQDYDSEQRFFNPK